MFAYYLELAWHSLARTRVLTLLMVLAIALGIGASMTMLTVLHVMSGDPLPGLSGRLYRPYLDPLPLSYKPSDYGPDPRDDLTWPDAMALLRARKGVRQAAMAGGDLTVASADRMRPGRVSGRYTTRDLFAMFGVPFVAGSAWSPEDDAGRARVVVLSRSLARQLFAGDDALGRTVTLEGHVFRVVGVVRDWHPRPLFYADSSARRFSATDRFFLPLSTAVALRLPGNGDFSGWGHDSTSLTSPTMTWLQFWVQLNGADQVRAYRRFLHAYADNQFEAGRYQRPASNARLYSLMGWLHHQRVIPGDVRLQAWLALGFLCVCMLNIVALLLAKFLRRSAEISVRRALGARRRDVFAQLGVEAGLLGLGGGVLGLVLAQVGLWSVRARPDDYAHMARMDPLMLLATFVLAVTASTLAGLVPAWRACRIPPALQLKTL